MTGIRRGWDETQSAATLAAGSLIAMPQLELNSHFIIAPLFTEFQFLRPNPSFPLSCIPFLNLFSNQLTVSRGNHWLA
jgi:hypothetical protein